jgi:hypothetical protein
VECPMLARSRSSHTSASSIYSCPARLAPVRPRWTAHRRAATSP